MVGLKSQSPRRRKHAAQLARPAIVDGSACQPNTASVSAEASIGARGSGVGEVGSILEGGGGETRKEEAWTGRFKGSIKGGVDMLEGSSVDMAARDS